MLNQERYCTDHVSQVLVQRHQPGSGESRLEWGGLDRNGTINFKSALIFSRRFIRHFSSKQPGSSNTPTNMIIDLSGNRLRPIGAEAQRRIDQDDEALICNNDDDDDDDNDENAVSNPEISANTNIMRKAWGLLAGLWPSRQDVAAPITEDATPTETEREIIIGDEGLYRKKIPVEDLENFSIMKFGDKTIVLHKDNTMDDVRDFIEKHWTIDDLRRYGLFDEELSIDVAFSDQQNIQILAQHDASQRLSSFEGSNQKRLRVFKVPKTWRPVQVFVSGVFGWTPPITNSITKLKSTMKSSRIGGKELIWAIFRVFFFLLLFLLEFSDTVVDLMIFFQDLIEGTEGYGRNGGILIGVMTITARILAGWYSVIFDQDKTDAAATSASVQKEIENIMMSTFCFVEVTIFIMEDVTTTMVHHSARIEEDLLSTISLYLATSRALVFLGYSLFSFQTIFRTLNLLREILHKRLRNGLEKPFRTRFEWRRMIQATENGNLLKFMLLIRFLMIYLFASITLYISILVILGNGDSIPDIGILFFNDNKPEPLYFVVVWLCCWISKDLIAGFKTVRMALNKEDERNPLVVNSITWRDDWGDFLRGRNRWVVGLLFGSLGVLALWLLFVFPTIFAGEMSVDSEIRSSTPWRVVAGKVVSNESQ